MDQEIHNRTFSASKNLMFFLEEQVKSPGEAMLVLARCLTASISGAAKLTPSTPEHSRFSEDVLNELLAQTANFLIAAKALALLTGEAPAAAAEPKAS